MNELQVCDEFGCTCTGFVSEEAFDPAELEVEELRLGEDS